LESTLNAVHPFCLPVGPGKNVFHSSATTAQEREAQRFVSARTLIECMQMQSRVYEAWMEVMSDYATVYAASEDSVAVVNNGAGSGDSSVVVADLSADCMVRSSHLYCMQHIYQKHFILLFCCYSLSS
jgi:hypothetical protein